MRHFFFVLIGAALAGCASGKPQRDGQASIADEPEVMHEHLTGDPKQTFESTATEEPENVPLLDRTQRTIFGITAGAAQKIDNIFGSADVEEEATVSRGRLSVGGQWDERNGLKKRFRLKARVALPAIDKRASLIFGRGEADELVDGSGDANIDSLPTRFNDLDDDDWLLGIGYTRDAKLRRGWSFGAGVKLASPIEPFLRATYRWNKAFSDDWLWRVEPRLFVQSQRGAGLSIKNTLDHAVNENWLLRSWSIAVVEEDVEGVSWTSKLIAYQNLSNKSAFAYAVYSTGETDYEVPVRDYGVELRYRRQISREWLFVEFLTYLSWPREFLIEEREPVLGVGIEFEMQFGNWPGRQQLAGNHAGPAK
jgi:hypothetical protein